MPIKAKQVNPQRASEVARGQLSTIRSSYTTAPNGANLRVLEASRLQLAAFGDDDDDSSTSTGSETVETPKGLSNGMRGLHQEPRKERPQPNDAEEFLLAAARERTKALLYPKSEATADHRSVAPVASRHNERLLKYEHSKARRSAAEAVLEVSLAPALSNGSCAIDSPVFPQDGALTPNSSQILPMTDIVAPGRPSNSKEDETNSTSTAQTLERSAALDTSDAVHLDPHQEHFATHLELFKGTHPGVAMTGQPAAVLPPPPPTFAQLEQQALQQLYRSWLDRAQGEEKGEGEREEEEEEEEEKVGEEEGERGEGKGKGTPLFVAAEHAAEVLAMAKVACLHRRSAASLEAMSTAPSLLPDEPMTLEEMVTASNYKGHLPAHLFSANPAEEGAPSTSPEALSQQGQKRLNRFWLSVMWIERLVSDEGFIRWLAAFLYNHHKAFMKHVIHHSKGKPLEEIDDHDHEEYDVYEKFGQHVSTELLHTLTQHVPDFDEAEFVEALYDYPISHDPANANEDGSVALESQGILSYQAWRIILGMSDFESFFLWIMDYIKEEYEEELDTEAPVAVGGARGLRALLQSTYRFGSKKAAVAPSAASLLLATVPPSGGPLAEPSSSPSGSALEATPTAFSPESQTPETLSRANQASDSNFFITNLNTLSKVGAMPVATPLDPTTQPRKLLIPKPPSSNSIHHFFTPNKILKVRAGRNLPSLQGLGPNRTSSGHCEGSSAKEELRSSYPGALQHDTSSKISGSGTQSTREMPSTATPSTKTTSVKKKTVRFASSTRSKAPNTDTKSKPKRKV